MEDVTRLWKLMNCVTKSNIAKKCEVNGCVVKDCVAVCILSRLCTSTGTAVTVRSRVGTVVGVNSTVAIVPDDVIL